MMNAIKIFLILLTSFIMVACDESDKIHYQKQLDMVFKKSQSSKIEVNLNQITIPYKKWNTSYNSKTEQFLRYDQDSKSILNIGYINNQDHIATYSFTVENMNFHQYRFLSDTQVISLSKQEFKDEDENMVWLIDFKEIEPNQSSKSTKSVIANGAIHNVVYIDYNLPVYLSSLKLINQKTNKVYWTFNG